jgi:hypothetical protein
MRKTDQDDFSHSLLPGYLEQVPKILDIRCGKKGLRVRLEQDAGVVDHYIYACQDFYQRLFYAQVAPEHGHPTVTLQFCVERLPVRHEVQPVVRMLYKVTGSEPAQIAGRAGNTHTSRLFIHPDTIITTRTGDSSVVTETQPRFTFFGNMTFFAMIPETGNAKQEEC